MLADRQAVATKILSVADSFGSRNPQQLKQLRKLLSQVEQRELFEGLFLVFLDDSKPDKRFERQQLAGRLLFMLRPRCPYDPKQVIRLAIESFDLSVEELPWYLVVVLGKTSVMEAIRELKTAPLGDRERVGLNTFDYWVNGYDGQSPKYY